MIEINTWCKFQVSLGYKFGNLIFSHTNKYKVTFMALVFVQKQKNVNSCKNNTEKDHHSFFSDASLWNLKYNSCTCTSGLFLFWLPSSYSQKKLKNTTTLAKKEI